MPLSLGRPQANILGFARSFVAGDPVFSDKMSSLEWGELISLSGRHRILPLVASIAIQPCYRNQLQPSQLRVYLHETLEVSRYRAALQVKFTKEIMHALVERGIPAMPRKGTTYDKLLYGAKGIRRSNDLDFYILPESREAALSVLTEMGFTHDIFDRVSRSLRKPSRSDLAFYSLYADHVPPLIKLIEDPFVPYIEVDLSSDLAWQGAPCKPRCDYIMQQQLLISGMSLTDGSQQQTAFHFIDCCLHLFREAYYEKSIFSDDCSSGVSLQKFIDTALLFQSLTSADRTQVSTWLDDELHSILGWVLHHTDEVLATTMSDFLARESSIARDPNTWMRSGGVLAHWHGTMIERCFSHDPRELFKES